MNVGDAKTDRSNFIKNTPLWWSIQLLFSVFDVPFKNLLIIYEQNTKENHGREKNTRRFCLDFLGSYNIYIENSLVNKLTIYGYKIDRFWS